MQPFEADEITIDNPEFKRPPGKIKKLALAIKIFSKSFETILLQPCQRRWIPVKN
ncbi:hypothetical protein [Salinisphaera sp. G21_0]|uniref:hypothetical protein n=1 Tax=Salinisphaera sp. G21_0 TaxID=2821094 RepID=UPI001ADA6279|nr:hypothetical protein [Salinisphaera sp. G21_0]MBO9483069.1 hypothetical protein [Salinisphaera sp. G21_0]